MSRLVVVSNRVLDPAKAAQAGGVAVALDDCLRERGGLWFGWSGDIESQREVDPFNTAEIAAGRLTLPLTDSEYKAYYLGYSNSVLWPVFHNRVDLAQFEAGYYAAYAGVNQRFAAALVPHLRPDDIIWVHDYHFIGMAKELRAIGVTNRIGFFLHIPFPPSQTFLTLPEHLELAHAFAAYDLVGLQTTTDVAHMIDDLEHGATGQLLPDGRMRVADREFSIASFPVGIDCTYFKSGAAQSLRAVDATQPARIIGVDRLDYTKGLPQKFRAFSRFLETYPSFRNRTVLTQIAAPTRESVEAYTDIRNELESLSGSINGSYGDLEWVPIHYINRAVPRDRLANIYRASAVGLVTPLRDGMNLVAKEYIAAQNKFDPGVLVLSRFAGAAEQLTEALIVNPYNVDEIAEAIRTAVEMPLDERRDRHGALMQKIETANVSAWVNNFIGALLNTTDLTPTTKGGGQSLRRAMRSLSKPKEILKPPTAAASSPTAGRDTKPTGRHTNERFHKRLAMKIAQIAPLIESVPPRLYGGTERIVSYLTEELVQQGHDVTLFASGDSQTAAKLQPCCPKALRLNPAIKDPIPYYMAMLDKVQRMADQFDILHFHIDQFHFPIFNRGNVPTLTTLHGRQDLTDLQFLYRAFPGMPLASISNSQRSPIMDANFAGTVYHGLPRDLLQPQSTSKRGYLAFLGRISPEKRVDRAIAIALAAGLPIKIAAKVDRADQDYYKQIEPLLQQPGVEFIGEIDEIQKERFLGDAAALVFPIDWPEPFGLVMIEAMACGTPVLAFRNGSVAEVIDESVTGAVVSTNEEAVATLPAVLALDRKKVRSHFEDHFAASRMARDYIAIYRSLLVKKPAIINGNQRAQAYAAPIPEGSRCSAIAQAVAPAIRAER